MCFSLCIGLDISMTSAALDKALIFLFIVSLIFLQILLQKPYNTAVDWFSAGVMIYEMATGKYPFSASIFPEKIQKSLINDVPTYPNRLDPQARDLIERVSIKIYSSTTAANLTLKTRDYTGKCDLQF